MLGAESRCLWHDVKVFQKCLEMCETGAESRQEMLRNVPEIMGASPWWVLLEKKH